MSLDDRIRQLTETIIQEVRGPVEIALQRVLDDVLKLAADEHDQNLAEVRQQLDRDRDSAVQAALDEAEARHRSVLDQADARHQAALDDQASRLVAEHESAVQSLRDQLGRDHEQALEAARAEAEQARQSAAEADLSLHTAHAADREAEMACTDRTLVAFRQFDAARSLTEVLDLLADRAAEAAGRAAILVVNGPQVRGWAFRGLGDVAPASIEVTVAPGTIFGLAAAQDEAVSTAEAPIGADGDALSTLLAAPADRAGLAVPVAVGGRVVAILYADDAGDRLPLVPSSWPEQVEILARHAARCLEVLTMSRAAAGSAKPAGFHP